MSRSVLTHRHFNHDEREFILVKKEEFNGQALRPENLEKLAELLVAERRFNLRKVASQAVKGVLIRTRRCSTGKPTKLTPHTRSRHRAHCVH